MLNVYSIYVNGIELNQMGDVFLYVHRVFEEEDRVENFSKNQSLRKTFISKIPLMIYESKDLV